MTTNSIEAKAKRELRRRITRQRRRVDRRVRSLVQNTQRLVSWQTYARRYPGWTVLAALGAGVAASGGLPSGWRRWLGLHFLRRAGDRTVGLIWRELKTIWDLSDLEHGAADGGDDGEEA
jgi:hypothetical protein